jgi:hypothetical protein
MDYVDKIDKEAGLIRLTIGQICTAGIAHNIYTGDRKLYATPFIHTVWENYKPKVVGLAIRIANNGNIISNPTYNGNAIISFLPKEFEGKRIHTVKVVSLNKRSVNVEPIEWIDDKGGN